MDKDQLFVIQPDFAAPGSSQRFVCPGCSEILGLFQYYPNLQSKVDVRFVTFQRPRPEIVDLIGADNQDAPVIVLGNASAKPSATAKVHSSNGHRFINDAREIASYLADSYGIGFPYPPNDQ